LRFGQGDAQPTLLGHGLPQTGIEGLARGQVGPYPLMVGPIVEQAPSRSLQGQLILR
jgi:hypothetical protein